MSNPKISVLMSVYNTPKKYIEYSVNSILNQTFKSFEFIIINDGSNVSTSNYLNKLKLMDKRIKLVNNSLNMGLTKALNIGIEHCTSNYVARHDADDISHLSRLELSYKFLEENLFFDSVSTNYTLISENSNIISVMTINNAYNQLRRKNIYIHGAKKKKKKSLLLVNCYDETMRFAQDYDLYLRMINNHNMKIGLITKNLYYLRQHNKSISSSKIFTQFYYATKAKVNLQKKVGIIRLFFLFFFIIKDFLIVHNCFIGHLLLKLKIRNL